MTATVRSPSRSRCPSLFLALALALAGPAVASAGTAAASAATGDLDLQPRWQAGEQRDYHFTKERLRGPTGGTHLELRVSGDLHLEVVSTGASGSVIALTTGATRVETPGQAENPLYSRMAQVMDGLRLLMDVSADGTLQRIRNFDEIRQAGRSAASTVAASMAASGAERAATDRFTSVIGSLFGDESRVRQVATSELQLLLQPLGRRYPRAGGPEEDARLPLPGAAAPVPTHARYALGATAADTGLVQLAWTQTADPAAFAASVNEAAARREAGKAASGPLPSAGKGPVGTVASLNERADFAIDARSGWVDHVMQRRVIDVNGGVQEETAEIVRRPAGDAKSP